LLSKNTKIKIYGTIILPVLYGCETWSVTLREEHRLRVFEKRAPRKIFRTKWDEVTGERKRVHNGELYDLSSSSNNIRAIKSRRRRLAGHVARMGDSRGAYRFWVGRREGKNNSEDLGLDGRIMLKCIFKKWDVAAWTGSIWLRIGIGRGSL
jgi:hypothetical protein